MGLHKIKYKRSVPVILLVLSLVLSAFAGCSGKVIVDPDSSEIRINEVMSSNSYYAPLPDGGYCDWAELYNPSDSRINLRGYALSDDTRKPLKWKIHTDLYIEPGGYALIYLSGLDMVDENGVPHSNFRLSTDGETLVFSAADGSLIQMLEIPQCGIDNVSYGIDERSDSGEYVWMSEPSPAKPCSCTTSADPGNLSYSFNGVIINEYMTHNTYAVYDYEGDYSDWLELYNPTDTDACMDGCSLSDSADGPGWYFPEGTVIPAGGCMLVFCDGKAGTADELHASFGLGDGDLCIVLYAASGLPMDKITVYSLPDNVSCGIDPEDGEPKLYASATPGAPNTTHAYSLADTIRSEPAGDVMISEALAVSSEKADGVSDHDYIELYNRSKEAVSLKGYVLSDSAADAKYTFPDVSMEPGGYLVVNCCTGTDALSTGFKLSCGGENIYLSDADGHLLDVFGSGRQEANICRGRLLSDLTHWYYFTEPTPGAVNSADSAYLSYTAQPSFSSSGGYTDKNYKLEITHSASSRVYYTTDGSVPDASDNLYDDRKGIVIGSTQVIRAVAIEDGMLPSAVTTATFITDEPHSIPVVTLTSEPDGLFDPQIGIYSYLNFLDGLHPNYETDTEREAFIEYFVDGRKAVSFPAGVRISGAGTRHSTQKSFAVILREVYGAGSVTYPFFTDNNTTTFRSFVFRQSGQEWRKSKLRDELCVSIMKNRVNCDYMDMTPAALYINGEYWGLYYIREKLNEDYVASKHGCDPDKVDILRSQTIVTAGTKDSFDELYDFLGAHTFMDDKNYAELCDMVDMDSLIDFWICETFFGNDDTANLRQYYINEDGGKWRWMIYDLDNAFYRYHLDHDPIEREVLDPYGHGLDDGSNTILTRKCFQNEAFTQKFLSRYCYHLKNTFAPERTTALLDELTDVIRDEIPRQCERWEEPTDAVWNAHLNEIRYYLEHREEVIIAALKRNFNLTDEQFSKIYDAA